VNTADHGPVVAVVGTDTGAGAELARGLEDLGASVAALDSAVLGRGAEFHTALGDAARRVGTLDGVVIASVGPGPTRSGAVAELDAEAWRARVEVPLQRTLVGFQGAHGSLRAGGGTLVLVVPTLSLVGAAGFGPWAAVTEGQRALAKAAGRAWGPSAITVHCVAVPAALLPGDREQTTRFDRPGQPAPALDPPDMRGSVAPVVHSLVSPAWRPVTGATVAVDGGVWMTP
jgi:NAD(P)-dependent dehydrogenase (short-subunit alcohol dehydrogenase family)